MKINNLALLLILAILNQSCAFIKNHHKQHTVVNFEYDNKPISINAPEGYCFYDEKNSNESDVVKIVREANYVRNANYDIISKVEFLLQECEEKKNFLGNKNPLFRNSVMIMFLTSDFLKELKKHRLERSREIYMKFYDKIVSLETADSLNKFMKETAIPAMKKKNDLKIIDKSINLQKEQKAELKLVHDQLFGNKRHILLSYRTKLVPNEASYDYHEQKVGDVTTKCVGATTLINYIPINLAICEDKKSEDWINLEDKIQQYVKSMIKLNSD